MKQFKIQQDLELHSLKKPDFEDTRFQILPKMTLHFEKSYYIKGS